MPNKIYSPSLKWIVIMKVIMAHFWSKKFFHNFRCNIIFNFKHFSTRACIFLWWIETELSFFSRSSNEDDLSLYVIFDALSCKECILLLRPLLWNIQAKAGFNYHYKIAVHDLVCVPNFWCMWCTWSNTKKHVSPHFKTKKP